jgi:hypothetical protein
MLPATVSHIVLRIFVLACALATGSCAFDGSNVFTKPGGLVEDRTRVDGPTLDGGEMLSRKARPELPCEEYTGGKVFAPGIWDNTAGFCWNWNAAARRMLKSVCIVGGILKHIIELLKQMISQLQPKKSGRQEVFKVGVRQELRALFGVHQRSGYTLCRVVGLEHINWTPTCFAVKV